jgi:hypothetical protein
MEDKQTPEAATLGNLHNTVVGEAVAKKKGIKQKMRTA